MKTTGKTIVAKAPESKRAAVHFVTEESHRDDLMAMSRPVEKPKSADLAELIRRASPEGLHQFD